MGGSHYDRGTRGLRGGLLNNFIRFGFQGLQVERLPKLRELCQKMGWKSPQPTNHQGIYHSLFKKLLMIPPALTVQYFSDLRCKQYMADDKYTQRLLYAPRAVILERMPFGLPGRCLEHVVINPCPL